MKNKKIFSLYALIIGLMALQACDDGEEAETEVPSFIKVDSFQVTTGPGQGTNHQNFSDVWVTVEDPNKFKGAYELPAKIPLLREDETEVILRPGIMQDGISSTRNRYPFFTSHREVLDLKPGEVIDLTEEDRIPAVEYSENISFQWMESFNDEDNINLEISENSTMGFEITNEGDEVFEGSGSLKGAFSEEGQILEVKSDKIFDIDPNDPAFMELNYRTDLELLIGIISHRGDETRRELKMGLNPTGNEWNKVYVTFSEFVGRQGMGRPFEIFLGAQNPTDEDNELFLDNIKFITPNE